MAKKQYGLFTATTMIVGIVIGSGIFFKSDNILNYTNGSIPLGILVFTIAAISIIFGSLTISELAKRTTNPGGIVNYANEFAGKRSASCFGWFQVFIYYPSVSVVLAWVVGIYVCMLFGWEQKPSTLMIVGGFALAFCFILNTISAKLGGYFQNATTVIKLIPLFAIAAAGLIYGDPKLVQSSHEAASISGSSIGWLAAIAPIAFSYDGWVVSTSIAHELKDAERNLPLSLIFAPTFILVCYILYFTGISILIGPENVMALGDDHVNVAAQALIGNVGAKVILIFIIISVWGTVNGFILGYVRLPYSMALADILPFKDKLCKKSENMDFSANSTIFAVVITLVWSVINYITMTRNYLPNSDVSEISIVTSYLLYIILYVCTIKLYKKGEIKSIFKGLIIPIIAIIGSLIILLGGLQNPKTIFYMGICFVVILISQVYVSYKMK